MSDSEDGSFGSTLALLMREQGVSYRGLAARTQLSAGYLNHLVHGNRPAPANDVIERIARAFAIEPDTFRDYRMRVVWEALAERPDLIDTLYRDFS